ncbi:MAG: hypothetical protein Fur0034_06380 [Desulfuromonadia bacterium]
MKPYLLMLLLIASVMDAAAETPLPPRLRQEIIDRLAQGSVPLQNGGVRRVDGSQGVAITVDLCPSSKPLDRPLFTRLVALSRIHPAPVAIAVTGRWLDTHPDDFRWLREMERSHLLDITWVNHSDTHPYEPSLPLSRTFLLTEGIDLEREITAVEEKLRREGVTPSPFFRFPGLVADRRTFDAVLSRGLIPIGSDAWLAKGEEPRGGSIILVHGNGNEPPGVARLLTLLETTSLPERLVSLTDLMAGGSP